jgi:hypothetical protein
VYYNYVGGLYVKTPQQIQIHRYDARDSLQFEQYSGASYYMDADEQRNYIYNPDGKLKEVRTTTNGKLSATDTYFYNAKGLLVKRIYLPLTYPQYSSTDYFHYDKNGNLTSSASKDKSGKVKDTASYKYDPQNRRIRGLQWKENMRLEDSTIITYTEKGKTVESFSPDAWRGKLPMGWRHRIINYDAGNKKLSEIEKRYHVTYIAELKNIPVFSYDSTAYEYWPNGNIKSANKIRTKKDKTIPYHTQTYNEDGNLLEDKFYDDEKLWLGQTYIYDEQGYKTSETTSGYGQQNYTTRTYNNSKGLPMVEYVYTPGGHLLQKYFYVYEYF